MLFIAGGEDPGLSALERHALEARGAANCRLVFQQGHRPGQRAAEWVERRGYGRAQAVDFASPAALSSWARGSRARGMPSPRRVPAFTRRRFWARCRPWRSTACRPCHWWPRKRHPAPRLSGVRKLGTAHAIFEELANLALWKRASRPEAGLFDPVPLDNFLVGALQGLEIPAASPALCRRLAFALGDAAEVHRTGRLHGAVRAGIAPPGHAAAAHCRGRRHPCQRRERSPGPPEAARSLGARRAVHPHQAAAASCPCPMTYRNLTGSALFRAAQTIDKRVLFCEHRSWRCRLQSRERCRRPGFHPSDAGRGLADGTGRNGRPCGTWATNGP